MALGAVLKKAFPFITAAAGLGGPVGTMAANAVGRALGIDKVDPTEDGISQAIAQAQIKDPDALLKMQQAEQEFQLQMRKLNIESAEHLLEMTNADRASARAREVAVKDMTPRILAYAVVALTFSAEGFLLLHGNPHVDGVVLGRILGTLDSALIMVLSYYFGSSDSSRSKDATLHEVIQQGATK